MPAAAVIAGGALLGGVASAIGASSAASKQQKAAQQATNAQMAMYNTTRNDLSPYQSFGKDGMNQLTSMAGYLNTPFQMTQQQLEKTPGYQFNLSQGLKAVNNEMGARGLLNSGAVMKGAANYATGLADSTYMDQFNMDQSQKTNIYNRLMGQTQLGENAAAQTGAYGTQTANQVGQNMIGAGNAAAAGTMGVANGIGGIGNNLSQYAMMSNMLGKGIFGS